MKVLGYEYEEYLKMGYVRQEGVVRQAFIQNGDINIEFGDALYAGIGGGVTVNVNLSELWRRVETKWDEIKKSCGWGD